MAEIACTHCNLKFDESVMIKECPELASDDISQGDVSSGSDSQTLYFCCKGCQGVYHLLTNVKYFSLDTTIFTRTIKFKFIMCIPFSKLGLQYKKGQISCASFYIYVIKNKYRKINLPQKSCSKGDLSFSHPF